MCGAYITRQSTMTESKQELCPKISVRQDVDTANFLYPKISAGQNIVTSNNFSPKKAAGKSIDTSNYSSPKKAAGKSIDTSNFLSLIYEPIMFYDGGTSDVDVLQQSKRSSVSKRSCKNLDTNHVISNSFKRIEFKVTLDELVDELGEREDVTNLLMFFEALWWWLSLNKDLGESRLSQMKCPKSVLEKIERIVREREWGTIDSENFYEISKVYLQIEMIREISAYLYERFREREVDFSVCPMVNDELVSFRHLIIADKKLKFHRRVRGCEQAGQCGFILKVEHVTYSGDANLVLCTDPEDYINTGIHLHGDEVRAVDIHLIIDYKDKQEFLFPFTWSPILQSDAYDLDIFPRKLQKNYRNKAVHLSAVLFPHRGCGEKQSPFFEWKMEENSEYRRWRKRFERSVDQNQYKSKRF